MSPDLAPVLQQEVEQFVARSPSVRRRGLPSLLTAPFTFVKRYDRQALRRERYVRRRAKAGRPRSHPASRSAHAGRLSRHARLQHPELAHSSRRVHSTQHAMHENPRPTAQHPLAPGVDGTAIKTTRQQVDQHTAPGRVRQVPSQRSSIPSDSGSRTTTPSGNTARPKTVTTSTPPEPWSAPRGSCRSHGVRWPKPSPRAPRQALLCRKTGFVTRSGVPKKMATAARCRRSRDARRRHIHLPRGYSST